MNTVLTLVIEMALITWITLLAAALFRARSWTSPGMRIALGNRDNLPPVTPFAGRAARTANNTMENFVLFAVIALVAQAAGKTSPQLVRGAEIFFWARVAYVPVYYAGVSYVRTIVWAVSIVGLGSMVVALFR
jgi:uncharacterized MAPEG superfamily protein